MKVWGVQQGTQEWLDLRRRIYRTASAAPIMMGASKKMSRSELIRMVATGDEKEFSEWVRKNLLEKGHYNEAAIRPYIESHAIGDDLYPITASDDDEYVLVSADGITEDHRHGWECKSWNEKKATQVRDGIVPEEDRWQIVQALVITPAEDWTYTVSDGTQDGTVSTVYRLQENDARDLMAGWKQFDEDVVNYVHVEPKAEVVAGPVLDLPAVSVQVSGQIAVIDNLPAFVTALREFVDDHLIRTPQTDQDFADLDAQIKTLKKAEDLLVSEERRVLSQIEAIDKFKRTKDMAYKLARDNRLMAEKLLESEKTRRRVEIMDGGKKAFSDHIASLNARLGKSYMPPIMNEADFAGAMKGKRTITSLEDAVATELARAKIAANEVADRIDLNLKTLRGQADGYQFLFADTAQLVTKANDDMQNVIKARIAEYTEKEIRRVEAERARMRDEEERKANEKLEQEKVRIRQEEEKRTHADAATVRVDNDAKTAIVESIASPSMVARSSVPICLAEYAGRGLIDVNMCDRVYSITVADAKRLRAALGAAILNAESAA